MARMIFFFDTGDGTPFGEGRTADIADAATSAISRVKLPAKYEFEAVPAKGSQGAIEVAVDPTTVRMEYGDCALLETVVVRQAALAGVELTDIITER